MKLRKLFLAVIAGAALLTACDKKEVDLGPAKLTVNPTDVSFEAEVSSQDISLVATRDWAVTALPDWVALSKEAGSANPDAQKLSISVTENKGYNRSATIVFSIGFARQAITINQVGPDGEIDNGDGTKEKPFTVAGAIAYVKELGADVESPKKVFVKGIVSTVETTYEASGTYGNATFNIVDEEGSSEVFKVFQTYYLGNVKWTKGDNNPDIKPNDEVIIYGTIYNYKGNTPETVGKGASFVYSLNGVNRGGDDSGNTGDGTAKGTGTLEDPYNPAGAAAAVANLTWTDKDNYDKTEPVYIKGKISKVSTTFEGSGSYGNASFTIVDETDGTGSFEVFQTYYLGNRQWKTGDTEVKVDDIVIVYGPIMNYKGNTPETVGKGASYIYSLNGVTDGGTVVPPTPIEHDGLTLETAFTASEANAWIMANLEDKASTEAKYYVKGKIQRFYQRDNADQNFTNNSYHQASFFITDDGTENKEKEFEAYQIDYLNDATFDPAKDTDVKVGDEVVIYGAFKRWGTTAETTDKGSAYLYSVNAGGQGGGGGQGGDGDAIKLTSESTWTAATDGTYKAGFEMTASNGVKFGVYKGSGTTDIKAPDEYSVRVYKNSVIVITAPTGTKITSLGFKANDYDSGKYCCDLEYVEGGTGTMTADKTTMMIGTFSGSAEKIVLKATVGQTRLVEAYVTLDGQGGGGQGGGGGEGGDTPAKPVNEGTLESPFTVADALIAAKDAELTGKEYYVKAVVGKDIAIKNGAASFELMDGTTDGKLTVVKAKSFKGAAFDGSEPLDWLDEVILKGTITEYSTLPALTEGELVKWNGKTMFKAAFTTIAQLNALATTTATEYTGTLENAVVSFVPDAKNVIIKDATGSVLYYKNGHGLKQGQTFSGDVTVKLVLYNNASEITAIDAAFTGEEAVVEPESVSLSALAADFAKYQNAYVKVKDLEVVSVDKKNINVKNGNDTYVVYSNAGNATVEVGKTITATGTICQYKGKGQIKAWTMDAVEVQTQTPAWTLKNLSELADGDIAVIVSIKEEDKFALSNDKGAGAAPTAVAFTEDGNPADNIQWTVSVSESKYSFTASGSNKLYCTAANNGVRVGTNENNIFVIDASGYLKNVATERYLGVYNKADWRCYTNTTGNTAGQTFKAYVKTK